MIRDLFDIRMNDRPRQFVDLPEAVFFDEFADHAEKLDAPNIGEFIPDGVLAMRLGFGVHGCQFPVNDQFGDHWFFVRDPNCGDKILFEVMDNFRNFFKE